MELRGVATEATRDFVVYYKKKGLGHLNALDPDKCISTDVTGCFEQACQVNYDRTNKHCTGLVNCHAFAGGGGPPPCYKVDDSTTSTTLVGCGKTTEITATGTTAIGYDAGYALPSGVANTFLGVGAGYKTSSGQRNVFIGFGAGQDNTTGSDNTFIGTIQAQGIESSGSNNIAIGSGVKVDNLDSSNQINIGNIIKAETRRQKLR